MLSRMVVEQHIQQDSRYWAVELSVQGRLAVRKNHWAALHSQWDRTVVHQVDMLCQGSRHQEHQFSLQPLYCTLPFLGILQHGPANNKQNILYRCTSET